MRSLALSLALAGLASGCADPLGRQPLSGSVVLKGEPLEQGSILFLPTSGDQGHSTGAMIQNGTFAVPRDKGLVPGVYRVVLSSQEDTGKIIPSTGPGVPARPILRERIPKSHTSEGDTRVEVISGGKNHFEFRFE